MDSFHPRAAATLLDVLEDQAVWKVFLTLARSDVLFSWQPHVQVLEISNLLVQQEHISSCFGTCCRSMFRKVQRNLVNVPVSLEVVLVPAARTVQTTEACLSNLHGAYFLRGYVCPAYLVPAIANYSTHVVSALRALLPKAA